MNYEMGRIMYTVQSSKYILSLVNTVNILYEPILLYKSQKCGWGMG